MLFVLPSPDTMALVAKQPYKPPHKYTNSQKCDRPFCTFYKIQGHTLNNCFKARNAKRALCTHCNLIGHLPEKCYRLHGYPPGHKLHGKSPPTGFSSANLTTTKSMQTTEQPVTFTKDQNQQLLSLLHSKEAPIASHSVNHAQANSNSSTLMNGPFVMDLGWHG